MSVKNKGIEYNEISILNVRNTNHIIDKITIE